MLCLLLYLLLFLDLNKYIKQCKQMRRKNLLLGLTLLGLSLIACQEAKKEKENKPEQMLEDTKDTVIKDNRETISLKSQLEMRKSAFNEKADKEVKLAYQEGLDDVKNSGVLSTAKQVGDLAPDFSLKNALGEPVKLSDYYKDGKVILTWYRGGWCPYCNLTLSALQEELPNFKKQGASLIALSPELPDESLSTSEKHELDFEVLSDLGNEVAESYGIVFKLTEEVSNLYNQSFALNEHNGDDSNELPLAATYIINEEGKIIYAFIDADYRKRAEPSEITEFLKQNK